MLTAGPAGYIPGMPPMPGAGGYGYAPPQPGYNSFNPY